MQSDSFTSIAKCKIAGKCLNWLIVMPKITQFDDQQYNFPVGIAYVSSALKASGRQVFTLNLNYKKETAYELLRACIKENKIDIVSSGGISIQYSLLKNIFDTAKQIKPDIITVAGGGIITSDPIPAMEALENVDYGVIGEGEITICDLAYAMENGLDVGSVNGLIYKNSSNWVITQMRKEIEDLDVLPWPDYEGFEYAQMLEKTPMDLLTARDKQERTGIVFYSRSCPYNCTFCFHSSGKKYRARTMDSFFKEFDWLMQKYAFDNVFLADEFFLRNTDFVRQFCERIKPYGIRWTCSGRVDNITKEMLEILLDAGCYRIGFGVESVNNHILKSMRKHITREQIESAFALCQDVGMEAQGNIIFGDLEETVETAMDTINWWKAHQEWALTMHWIIAYPGCHVYEVSCERGIISDRVQFIKDGCPEVNFSKMTTDERRHIASVIDMLVSEGHDTLSGATIVQGETGKVIVTGNCPYCGEVGTYLNLDPLRPIKLENCPACHRTLRLYASDYADFSVFSQNMEKLLSTRKIAFWPVITGLAKVFESAPVLANDDLFVVDISPYKQGMTLCGKIIQSPEIIKEKSIDTVIITTSTSVGSDIIQHIKTGFPQVKKIELIGNLFFSSEKQKVSCVTD